MVSGGAKKNPCRNFRPHYELIVLLTGAIVFVLALAWNSYITELSRKYLATESQWVWPVSLTVFALFWVYIAIGRVLKDNTTCLARRF